MLKTVQKSMDHGRLTIIRLTSGLRSWVREGQSKDHGASQSRPLHSDGAFFEVQRQLVPRSRKAIGSSDLDNWFRVYERTKLMDFPDPGIRSAGSRK
jgi:hypothetical protein